MIILCILILFGTIAGIYVYGAIFQSSSNDHTGEIPQGEYYAYRVDDTPTIDGDTIAWGELAEGQNTKSLNVTAIQEIRIFLYVDNLPTDWTLTWAYNNTVMSIGDQRIDDIILTVPSPAVPGNYTWTTSLVAEALS
jgi:hypothetical protein